MTGYTHTLKHTCKHLQTHTHTHLKSHMQTPSHPHTHTDTNAHKCTHTHTHTYMHASITWVVTMLDVIVGHAHNVHTCAHTSVTHTNHDKHGGLRFFMIVYNENFILFTHTGTTHTHTWALSL